MSFIGNLIPNQELLCKCFIMCTLIARFMGPTWGPSGPAGPRWAPCWPHETCCLCMFCILWCFIESVRCPSWNVIFSVQFEISNCFTIVEDNFYRELLQKLKLHFGEYDVYRYVTSVSAYWDNFHTSYWRIAVVVVQMTQMNCSHSLNGSASILTCPKNSQLHGMCYLSPNQANIGLDK